MKTLSTTLRAIDARVYTLGLALVCIGLIAVYMYLVGMSVVHVVMNKEVSQQLVAVQTEITELESAYIDAQHLVRAEIAMQRGFVSQPDKVFIESGDSAVVLSVDDR